MKNIHSLLMRLLLVAVFTFAAQHVTYADTSRDIHDTEKVWSIDFNDDVNAQSLQNNAIYITDSKGKPFNADVKATSAKTVHVIPTNNYVLGEVYTLTITTNVTSKTGTPLAKAESVDFILQNGEFKIVHMQPAVDSYMSDLQNKVAALEAENAALKKQIAELQQTPNTNTDAADVKKAAAELTMPTSVTANMTLPKTGTYSTSIAWKSSNEQLITSSGIVTRPATDTTVTLTATISKGSATETKAFQVTVKAQTTNSASELSGTINRDMTLTKRMSPYTVTGNIQLAEGAVLNVEEGVVIEGNGYTLEVVNTKLNIVGTSSSRVVVNNLHIEPKSPKAEPHPEVYMEYAKIVGGTPAQGGAKFTMKNSIVENTKTINLINSRADNVFERNLFKNAGEIIVAPSKQYNKAEFKNNYFNGGHTSIVVDHFPEGETIIQYNSFNPTTYAIKVTNGSSKAQIRAQENYWGTTDKTAIQQIIFDKQDDANAGVYVDYSKMLQTHDSNTPLK
ncbi:MAG: Ig-like domain-containing protein, partial [Caryophanon sp.]|nr:Ig-like domain-containing protein [Caryophanon sp.]